MNLGTNILVKNQTTKEFDESTRELRPPPPPPFVALILTFLSVILSV